MTSPGALIRRALGRYERPVSDLYRSIFVNLEDLATQTREWCDPLSILEIGCGEGALAELLTRDFPSASYLGIDIIPHLGRMYEGRRENVVFREISADALVAEAPNSFDLIVINDVIHHVPDDERLGIFEAAKNLLSQEGHVLFKDWVKRPTPIHGLCYFADAYVGGDRSVRYMPMEEQLDMIQSIFGPSALKAQKTIRPWSQNHAFLIQNPTT